MKTDNQIIAEFMGERIKLFDGVPRIKTATDGLRSLWSELQYDTSWDWLMPVVHKILIEWIPESGGWPHEYTLLQKMLLGSRIKQVYTAVVEFIKFYNEKNQK